jgi:hypothetical protein
MSNGWLTPNSLKKPDGSWRISSDGDSIIPNWEFPNASGKVLLDTTQQALPTAQALTVAVGGTVTPTQIAGLIAVLNISGAGGLADDLDSFTVPAAWIGKLILCRMAAAGTITIKRNANIVMATDITLDAVEDRALFEVTAANTVVKHWNVSNA